MALGCWSAPSLLAGERPRAALTCEGYAVPNTRACVLFPAVACVRLFAAPVEAGYVTSSALLSSVQTTITDALVAFAGSAVA